MSADPTISDPYINARELRRIRAGAAATGEIQFVFALRRSETISAASITVEKIGIWRTPSDYDAISPIVTDEIVISTHTIGGTGIHLNKSVLFTFQGGVAGTRYRIIARITSSTGRQIDGLVRLDVLI